MEDAKVLRAIGVWRPLHEIATSSGVGKRRCRTILQRLRKRGLAKSANRLWKITPDGRRYLGEIEAEAARQARISEKGERMTVRDEFAAHLAMEKLTQQKAVLAAQARDTMQELEELRQDYANLPFAGRYIAECSRLEGHIRWFAERLERVRDDGELNQIRDELEPLIAQARNLASRARRSIERRRGFELISRDDKKMEVKLRCLGCGFIQTHTLWSERGEARVFECGRCGVRGGILRRASRPA